MGEGGVLVGSGYYYVWSTLHEGVDLSLLKLVIAEFGLEVLDGGDLGRKTGETGERGER